MILSKVRGKNFFSIGNDFLEIDLLKYKRALLTGKNGEGKSTQISMLTFALFGKTIKQVTKAQIINSINNKNCVVEIELKSGGKEYMIRRGIKPSIFEIYEFVNDDKVLLDQKLVGDYQEFLESTIIGCSYRTFTQTSILSVENYKPFMSLAAAERRAFIEDILDIKVFSVMDTLVKADIKKAKEKISILESDIRVLKNNAAMLQESIDKIDKMVGESSDVLVKELEENTDAQEAARKRLDALEIETATIALKTREIASKKRLRDDKKSSGLQLKTKLDAVSKTLKFFTEGDNCPTCKQPIDPTNVKDIVDTHAHDHDEIMLQLKAIAKELQEFSDLGEIESEHSRVVMENAGSTTKEATIISTATRAISLLSKKIKELEETAKNSDPEKEKLKLIAINAKSKLDELIELKTEQEYNSLMAELFKDSGIKSKIVERYIPVINTMMNEYLEKMELFVSFELDSEFNETIKSRHRDAFTYNSFSAGEKMRIELAIMFTMRRLSTMKNSFFCNVLCADEVLDAACDSAGVTAITEILLSEEFAQTNLFVVSHRNTDLFEDICDGKYIMTKRDGFSQISE